MGLLDGLFAIGDTAKKNVRGLLSDPKGWAEQMADQLRNYNRQVVPTISGGQLYNRPMTDEEQYRQAMTLTGIAPVGMTKVVNKLIPDPNIKALPEPQSWYHGSPADIYGSKEGWFRPSEGESGVPVIWATRDPFSAEGYTRGEISMKPDANGKYPLERSWYKDYDGNGGVYSLIDNSKNPFIYDAGGKDWVRVPQGRVMREAKAAGHDSVVFKNISDNYDNSGITSDVIAWFDPSVISKARGAADPSLLGAIAGGGLLGAAAAQDWGR